MLTPVTVFIACGTAGSSAIFGVRVCGVFFVGLLNLHVGHRIFNGRIVVRRPGCARSTRQLRGLGDSVCVCGGMRRLGGLPGFVGIFFGCRPSGRVRHVDSRLRGIVRSLAGAEGGIVLRGLGLCPVLTAGTRAHPFRHR